MAPQDQVSTGAIYRGAVPFIAIQAFGWLMVALFPGLVTFLL